MGDAFFESGDTEVFKIAGPQWELLVHYLFIYLFITWNKLFARNEKKIDNHTLMLDMIHSYISIVYTHHWSAVFKIVFWYGCCSLKFLVLEQILLIFHFFKDILAFVDIDFTGFFNFKALLLAYIASLASIYNILSS